MIVIAGGPTIRVHLYLMLVASVHQEEAAMRL